jgi:hypothetical protein
VAGGRDKRSAIETRHRRAARTDRGGAAGRCGLWARKRSEKPAGASSARGLAISRHALIPSAIAHDELLRDQVMPASDSSFSVARTRWRRFSAGRRRGCSDRPGDCAPAAMASRRETARELKTGRRIGPGSNPVRARSNVHERVPVVCPDRRPSGRVPALTGSIRREPGRGACPSRGEDRSGRGVEDARDGDLDAVPAPLRTPVRRVNPRGRPVLAGGASTVRRFSVEPGDPAFRARSSPGGGATSMIAA